MENSLVLALLNPTVASLLSASFFVLWRYRTGGRHLLLLSAAYLICAIAFVLQIFTLPIGWVATRILSNLCFTVAAVSIASGVITRYGRPAPLRLLTGIGAAGLAGLCWFMVVEPDMAWRIFSMNAAMGTIAFIIAGELWRSGARSGLDRAMIVVCLLSGTNFVVRSTFLIMAEQPFVDGDGFATSFYWMTMTATHILFSLMSGLTLMLITVRDAYEALRRESENDRLSGLLNRRGFEDRAGARLAELNGMAALVVADIDHFKAINDNFGHAAGDAVIANFGREIAEMCPEGIAGRIGGEEFAMLLPHAELSTARLFAEALRSRLATQGLADRKSGDVPHFTASFGVASCSAGQSLSDVLVEADRALYSAKDRGRDKVVCQAPRDASAPMAAPAAHMGSAETIRIAR